MKEDFKKAGIKLKGRLLFFMKIIAVILIWPISPQSLASTTSYNKEVNFVIAPSLYDRISLMDNDSLGRLFLAHTDAEKWRNVKNDEFEAEEAINQAVKSARDKIKQGKGAYNKIINKVYHTYLSTKFKKYDFKGNYFPVDLLGETSFLRVRSNPNSTKYLSFLYFNAKLSFDNTSRERHQIKMKKNDAKKFLQGRKKSGYIYKDVLVKYSFKISSIKYNNLDLISKMNLKCAGAKDIYEEGGSYRCSSFLIDSDVVGHIVKIEIIDPRNNDAILQSYAVN